jgi:hypothetical protein
MPAIAVAAIAAAASTGGAVVAARSQAGASKRATAAQTSADNRAYAWETQAEATRKAEADRVAEESRRQWDIEEANRVQLQTQADEDRLWSRERMTGLDAQSAGRYAVEDARYAVRDARMAPYRAASLASLQRLPGIIQQGSVSPGAHAFTTPLTMAALLPKERR